MSDDRKWIERKRARITASPTQPKRLRRCQVGAVLSAQPDAMVADPKVAQNRFADPRSCDRRSTKPCPETHTLSTCPAVGDGTRLTCPMETLAPIWAKAKKLCNFQFRNTGTTYASISDIMGLGRTGVMRPTDEASIIISGSADTSEFKGCGCVRAMPAWFWRLRRPCT